MKLSLSYIVITRETKNEKNDKIFFVLNNSDIY